MFQILIRDMIQFGTIFAVFLFSFSGAFYLALRGEIHTSAIPTQEVKETNCTLDSTECNSTTADENRSTEFVTSLNIYPYETS